MKSLTLTVILTCIVVLSVVAPTSHAADQSELTQKWEYAVVKWDAPDRIYYYFPDKFELVYLKDLGIKVPKEARQEEFCLAWAANKMAADGWDAVNLHSRRILMRRQKAE